MNYIYLQDVAFTVQINTLHYIMCLFDSRLIIINSYMTHMIT